VVVAFDPPFAIIDSVAGLDTSAKRLLLTQEFINTTNLVMALPADQQAKHISTEYVARSREIRFPAFNRGESATLKFWVHSPLAGVAPSVRVTTEKAGVKIISRPALVQGLNVTELKKALPIGVSVALVGTYAVAMIPMSPIKLAFAGCLIGTASGTFGFAVLKLVRSVKLWL
jgi:hypothetical protein